MTVNFICDGVTILSKCDIPYIPDNEDRVVISKDFYIVDDRKFILSSRKHDTSLDDVNIYLTRIS